MKLKKGEPNFSQIGAVILITAFILFLYADINIYHYSKFIIMIRLSIICLFAVYLLISFLPMFQQSNIPKNLFLFSLIMVFVFMDYLLIVNSMFGTNDLNRPIQVAMAINFGMVLFSEDHRKYISRIVLVNMFLVLGVQMIVWKDLMLVFFTYFNLIAFNIGLYVFNQKFNYTQNAKIAMSDQLSRKVNELEVELAIQEMLEMELKQKANHDRMTEFLNRGEGMKVITNFFIESQENNYPLSVCYFDLNDLKTINDTLGHEVGDQYILDFVDIMKSTIRNDDICVRMGGDEFLIILNNVSFEDARQIWEKMQSNMEAFKKLHSRQYELSVSHGICERIQCHASTCHELIRIADERMFKEKKKMKQKLA